MLLISHRGNTDSIKPHFENQKEYIDESIKSGFDVEIDIWYADGLFLGHDEPQYFVDLSWLQERENYLWIHTKNFQALSFLINTKLRLFFHEKEKHTIIHNTQKIWSHNIEEANQNSIIPLLSLNDLQNFARNDVFGICSDFVVNYME